MPYRPQPEQETGRQQRPEPAQTAARDENGRYQLLPEYSIKNWQPPKEVQETIEEFCRKL